MAINKKELAKAIKTIAENPNKIEAAKQKYRDRMAEIQAEERKGLWAPVTLKKWREDAQADRDRVCHALARAMENALAVVKENNSFEDCAIDLENPKLDRALKMLDILGSKMSFSDQANIVSQFAGDFASLRVLQAAFEKSGQKWAADAARSLQRPISQQALDECEQVLAFHNYAEAQGRLDFPAERMMWTHPEFQKAGERYGLDLDGAGDSYELALDVTMQALDDAELNVSPDDPEKAAKAKAYIAAQRYKCALGKQEIAQAKASGKDPAEVFNKVMKTIEAFSSDGGQSVE